MPLSCCTDCLYDDGDCDGCDEQRPNGECGPSYCEHGCLHAAVGDGVCDWACAALAEGKSRCGTDGGDCDSLVVSAAASIAAAAGVPVAGHAEEGECGIQVDGLHCTALRVKGLRDANGDGVPDPGTLLRLQ